MQQTILNSEIKICKLLGNNLCLKSDRSQGRTRALPGCKQGREQISIQTLYPSLRLRATPCDLQLGSEELQCARPKFSKRSLREGANPLSESTDKSLALLESLWVPSSGSSATGSQV